jgi:hypothetical protein
MRQKALIVAAVMGLVTAVLAAPAAAAPAPVGERTGVVLASATALPRCGPVPDLTPDGGRSATGGTTADICVRGKDTPLVAGRRTAVKTAAIALPTPLTQECKDNPDPDVWRMTRVEACIYIQAQAFIRQIGTGRLLGVLDFDILLHSDASTQVDIWNMTLDLEVLATVGETLGSVVSGEFTCTDCFGTSIFPPQAIGAPGNTAAGRGSFDSELSSSGEFITSHTQVFLQVGGGPNTIPDPGYHSPVLDVRCDSATPGTAASGCVNPQKTPVLPRTVSLQYPAFAQHVAAAQESGLPGSPQSGRALHRLTDPGSVDANREKACPGAWERPDGREPMSCDEYPFASTYEGAAFEDAAGFTGRTFDFCKLTQLPPGVSGLRGWSSCWIPLIQNTRAGSVTGRWYTINRILDGESFFIETP